MSTAGTVLVLAGGAALIGAAAFRRARAQVADRPASRRALLLRHATASVTGVLLALAVPPLVPETPGSPATLVMMAVLWIVGGGLALLGGASLLGVLSSAPER